MQITLVVLGAALLLVGLPLWLWRNKADEWQRHRFPSGKQPFTWGLVDSAWALLGLVFVIAGIAGLHSWKPWGPMVCSLVLAVVSLAWLKFSKSKGHPSR